MLEGGQKGRVKTRNQDNSTFVRVSPIRQVPPLKCPEDCVSPDYGEGSTARIEAGINGDKLQA